MVFNAFAISMAAAGTVWGIIGINMCLLAVRTGKVPERLLAVCFLGWSVAYLSYLPLFALPDGSFPPAVSLCASLGDAIGYVACAVFIHRVFSRQGVWARWLLVTAIACLVGGFSGSIWVGDLEVVAAFGNPFYWLYRAGCGVIFFRLGAEAITAYVGETRRRAIGLGDAMVGNRFFLLFLAAALSVALELLVAYNSVMFSMTGTWFPPMDYLLVVIEGAAVATFWFVFLPPRFYRNWIKSCDGRLKISA